MDQNHGERNSSGVVCCLLDLGDGVTRLILDDVSNSQSKTASMWKHEVLFTWKDLPTEKVNDISLSDKELADFGYQILARLVAQQRHPYEQP